MSSFPRSWRRRALVACAGAALATSYAVAVPAAATSAPARFHPATMTSVALPALAATATPSTGGLRIEQPSAPTTELAPRRTTGFGLVGVTWARGTGLSGVSVEVRTRSHGEWSTWTTLEADSEDDAGGRGTRQGTEPLWVGSADGVAVRVRQSGRGTAPQDVKVDLVDPGAGAPADTPSARTSATPSPSLASGRTATSAASPAYTPMPGVITRAQWGARKNTQCDTPHYGSQTLGVILHHTAGSNSYSKSQSAAIVRGIQTFHMQGRGWCDIGYNFLVDKYGQIFQGRNGDMLRNVRGAHAGNFDVNTYDMGVSMMGNFDTARPSSALKQSVIKLIGWRLGTNYLSAWGTYRIDGHTLKRISGHRDVYNSGIRPATSTDCPGRYGYQWLTQSGGLRQQVATYISGYQTAIKRKYTQLGRSVTGPVYVGEYPVAGGYRTIFGKGEIDWGNADTGPHWLKGPILREFYAVGGLRGSTGFPKSEILGSGADLYQKFQHGVIYRPSPKRGFWMSTPIAAKYAELGAYDSKLGAPTTRTTTSGNVERSTFEHGRISYNTSTDTTTVTYS